MKKIVRVAKLQFSGGAAKPGPALASIGVNIMDFCNQFNKATTDQKGEVVPVTVTVYDDKTFTFVIKTTPTAVLLKKYAQITKGAQKSGSEKVATLTRKQVTEVAQQKLPDLNTDSIDKAVKIVLGTMKQMGIKLVEESSLEINKK